MNMMTNLSEATVSENTLHNAVLVLIIAVIAFVLLASLYLAVSVCATLRRGKSQKSIDTVVIPPAAAAGEDDAAVAAAIAAAIVATEDQGAILAAITAAISVVWESEHPGTGFRVVSYRHIDKRSPWNAK